MTAGGSICIAALTLSGGLNSWTPEYSVESILNVVLANMCADCCVELCRMHGCIFGCLIILLSFDLFGYSSLGGQLTPWERHPLVLETSNARVRSLFALRCAGWSGSPGEGFLLVAIQPRS